MTFGRYLRETRMRHQMPISALAACTGIPKDALQAMESRQRLPSYAELQRLAIALRCSEAELLQHAGIVGPGRSRSVET